MKIAQFLTLTAAGCLVACGTEKPAVSDTLTTATEIASSTEIAAPSTTAAVPPAAESVVPSAKTTKVPATPTPSAARSAPVSAPVSAQPAPKPAVTPPATKPVVAPPAATPATQPATAPPPSPPPAAVAVVPSAASDEGKTLYEDNCRKCHGVRGIPPKTMKAKYPKIATFDAEFFAKRSDDSVVTVLTNGKNENMKSFKSKMSRAQMYEVAAYIRTFVK